MKLFKKKVGLGSLSFLLLLVSIVFIFSYIYFSIGGEILGFLGLGPWVEWDIRSPYTMLYSLIFTIPAILLGYKYNNHFGAKAGKSISIAITSVILVFTLGYEVGFQFIIS
ncbi:hypothetical protein [Clostridium sp.]|uniref:hypothetical protein n=1 Tax=Clostridium sp. TaxID=1506 RepID=UPI003217D9BA